MAFTVEDFQDLARLLAQRPEWRSELRRLVLSDELLELPALVRELVGAQRRADERLGRLETALAELAEAQRGTAERVAELAEAQRRTDERLGLLAEQVGVLAGRVDALTERVDGLSGRVDHLAEGQDRLRDDVATLRGSDLERRYREHVSSYFRPLVRGARVMRPEQLDALLDEGVASGALDEDAADDVRRADLIALGRRPDGDDAYLVIEVSVVIDVSDVERAARRASLLGRLRPTLAVVAGERLTSGADDQAAERSVWRLLDGRAAAPAAG